MAEEAPTTYPSSVFGRAILDLHSLTLGDHGKLLLSNEYAEGLALERRRLGREVNLLFFSNLAILLAMDAIVGKQIGVSFVVASAQGISLGREIFVAAATMIFGIFVLRYLSLMMLTINTIFNLRNIESPEFLIAHKDATFLVTETFRVRNVGYQSSFSHRAFVIIFALVTMLIFGFQLTFQVFAILENSRVLMQSAAFFPWAVGLFGTLVVAICLFGTLAAMSLKFHFRAQAQVPPAANLPNAQSPTK
jgi:hypothetical protein